MWPRWSCGWVILSWMGTEGRLILRNLRNDVSCGALQRSHIWGFHELQAGTRQNSGLDWGVWPVLRPRAQEGVTEEVSRRLISEIEPSVTIPLPSSGAIISRWKFPKFPPSAPWRFRAFPAHYPAGLGGCLNHHLRFILLGGWENDNPKWFPRKEQSQVRETGIPIACRDSTGTRLTHVRFTWACSPLSLKCLIQLAGGEGGEDFSLYFSWVNSSYPHFPQWLSGKTILHFVAKANLLRGLLQP